MDDYMNCMDYLFCRIVFCFEIWKLAIIKNQNYESSHSQEI